MGFGVVLGAQVGPFAGCIDSDLLQRYAAATNDPSPLVRAGRSVPPTALVTQIWDAQNEARAVLVAEEVQRAATGGVHGEHDIVLHRPIVPGEPLSTWVEGHGARPAGRNCAVTLRYSTRDERGELVAEQWWTTIWFGTTCDPSGDPAPDHAFPAAARDRPLATIVNEVDLEMAHRYAEVSGDWSAHHFDPAAARRTGTDRVFLHGLCTMALCAQSVTQLVAAGDPERLRRVAVRFASPTFLGERLDVRVHDAGAAGVAFEADSAGTAVVTNGRVELR